MVLSLHTQLGVELALERTKKAGGRRSRTALAPVTARKIYECKSARNAPLKSVLWPYDWRTGGGTCPLAMLIFLAQ